MRKLGFLLVGLLCVPAATLRGQTKIASTTAGSQSMSLSPARGNFLSYGMVTVYFTTYDGAPGFPLTTTDDRVSSELRPRAGNPGVYECDYIMLDDFGNLLQYGWITINLPATDTDANGLPDIAQKKFAGIANISGSGRSDWPSVDGFSLSGELYRAANSPSGPVTVDTKSSAGTARFYSTVRVGFAEGQVQYTRGFQNTAQFSYQETDAAGTVRQLTASTTFTVVDQNRISLPDFTLRSDMGEAYLVKSTTLTRSGNRYSGTARLVDGALETSWADYAQWVIDIVDTNDSDRNGVPDLSDPNAGPEYIKPTVTITSPAANARISNELVVVRGTAADNRGVREVSLRLNGGSFGPVNGTTSWSKQVRLVPGTNVIALKATDIWGNVSATQSVRVVYVPTSILTVTITGNGTISPNLNGQALALGAQYSCTAVPGGGFVFSNWSGQISSENANLTFTMTSNLVLQANFITSPFLTVTGLYSGLFYDTNEVLHESSGFVLVNVGARGAFSGYLLSAGESNVMSGRFGLNGVANVSVQRLLNPPLNVHLQIDMVNGTDQIVGTITDGDWMAVVATDRYKFHAVNNPAPQQGRYTLMFPGDCENQITPAGDGYASFKIGPAGRVVLEGAMGDGSALSQSAYLNKNGTWPLYVALYAGKGSVLGWINCSVSHEIAESEASWIRPTMNARRYAAGFTNNLLVSGSEYVQPANAFPLDLTNAQLIFCGGGLNAPVTNLVEVASPTRFNNLSSNALQFVVNPTNGFFSGYVVEPGTNKTNAFKGALLQKQNSGVGYFLGPGTSGRVRVEALSQ